MMIVVLETGRELGDSSTLNDQVRPSQTVRQVKRGQRLYRLFDKLEYAQAMMRGSLRFGTLALYRDFEEQQVRGDCKEGTNIYAPSGGLKITKDQREDLFDLRRLAPGVRRRRSERSLCSAGASPLTDRMKTGLRRCRLRRDSRRS